MIVDERMRTYINSLDMGNTPFLEELEQYAIRERVPIIRREMQSFIKMFLAVNRPKRILEVGTAIGFSTLLMCEYGPEDLEIVTIENYEKRIPIAKENFRRAGREAQITLLEGDAGQILKELEDSFDIERRNRTIYKRMREYLYELKHNPSLITSIIPLGDGVTVSVKQE